MARRFGIIFCLVCLCLQLWGGVGLRAEALGESVGADLMATILSTRGEVRSLGNRGSFPTKRFIKALEKVYLSDRIALEGEGSALVLRLRDGWRVSVRGEGFVSFTGANERTGGLTMVIEAESFLAEPPGSGHSEGEERWLHVITSFGALQNKHSKMLVRGEQSYRDRREQIWEVVALPHFEEQTSPLVLIQTPNGDTWISGQESRVVLERGVPPPAKEEIRMVDYQDELERMSSLSE